MVAWPVEMDIFLKLTEARPSSATYPAKDSVAPQVPWTLLTSDCRGHYRMPRVPSSGRTVQDAGALIQALKPQVGDSLGSFP